MFRYGNERGGWDPTALGVAPAGQGLQPGELARVQGDLGLVIEGDLLMIDRPPQVRAQQ